MPGLRWQDGDCALPTPAVRNELALTLIVVVALGVAAVDWFAVRTNRTKIEAVAKPLVMATLLLAVLGGGISATAVLVALGLACSLIGDVLLLARFDRFLAGLGAFFVGHLFFVSAFLQRSNEVRLPWLIAAGVVALVLVALTGRPIVAGASKHRGLAVPVCAYVAVLTTMVIAGAATGAVPAALGAFLFAGSDAVLGWNRFVAPLSNGRLWTHVPYHFGQALIAVWAIGAPAV